MERLNQDIDPTSIIGKGTRIWANVQIRSGVIIGSNCVVGRNVNIGPHVSIGNNCKLQNACEINGPSEISDGVFIGPGVLITNDHNPRAIDVQGKRKTPEDWEATSVSIDRGASIGAGAILISPLKIGKWALVGAGAVVTSDVPDFGLVTGVPGKLIGWVGKAGVRLVLKDGVYICPITNEEYLEVGNLLREKKSIEGN